MGTVFGTVFAIAGLLAVISILPAIAQRLKLPYSVVLALVGIAVGLAATFGTRFGIEGPVGDLLQNWHSFTATSVVFMIVFLPILLFEASIGIDLRELLDDAFPVLLLAVVAVVVATFVVGGALAAVGPFSLLTGLLIASIVSTTDPAAVIAIFRDLGAPRRLSLLVEGEAVFNDAAAITLFSMIIAAMTAGGGLGVAEGLWLFVEHFAGGLAVGIVLAVLVNLLMPRLRDHRFAELTMTIGGTYLAYLLTEHYLHASGVVAVVVFAITFGSFARTRVSPESWRYLRQSWAMLGFWANSLIFILAAMLAPKTLATITLEDVTILAVLIVAALVARAGVLFGLMPVLTQLRLAQNVDFGYKAVIVWGGLRGAVTLALALAATENPLLAPEIKRFVGVLATSFVLWTLLVNGLSLKSLIRVVGLDKLSPGDIATRDRVMALSLAEVKAQAEAIAIAHRIDDSATSEVTGYYDRRLDELGAVERPTGDDLSYAGLVTLAHREHAIYFEMFENRVIGRAEVAPLAARAERLVDGAKAGGLDGYRRAADKALALTGGFQSALWIQRRLGLQRPLASALEARLEHLLIMQAALRELGGYVTGTLDRVFGGVVVATLQSLVAERLEAVEDSLDTLKLQYPDYAHDMQARYLARAAFVQEAVAYRAMLQEGILNQEVFDGLIRELDDRRERIVRPARLDLSLSAAELVALVPLFVDLDAPRLAQIGGLLKPRLAVPGEIIVTKGARADAMYFISSGALEVDVPGAPVRLGSGSFFGEMALVFEQPRNANVVALGYCQLLMLSKKDFERVTAADPAIRAAITAVAQARTIRA